LNVLMRQYMSSGFTNMHAMPVEASSCYRKPEVPWRGRTGGSVQKSVSLSVLQGSGLEP
jgi:hypothetical protein